MCGKFFGEYSRGLLLYVVLQGSKAHNIMPCRFLVHLQHQRKPHSNNDPWDGSPSLIPQGWINHTLRTQQEGALTVELGSHVQDYNYSPPNVPKMGITKRSGRYTRYTTSP